MTILRCTRRPFAVVLAASLTTIIAGCGPDLSGLPADASQSIASLVADGRDAYRASVALGWGAPPLANFPAPAADVDAFKRVVCEPPLFPAHVAAKALQSFNEEVADLAKAPDDTLGSNLKAIHDSNKKIKDIAATTKTPDDPAEAIKNARDKCLGLVDRDLALAKPSLAPQAVPGTIPAILALGDLLNGFAGMIEKSQRAELVRAYVVAHEPEITKALEVLASKEHGLAAVVQTTRTYQVRRAFAAYRLLDSVRNPATNRPTPPLATADEYAQFAARYLKLQGVEVSKIMDDADEGLRPAYKKFMAQIRDGKSDPYAALDNFLGVLKGLTDLDGKRQDFLKAKKDAFGSGP